MSINTGSVSSLLPGLYGTYSSLYTSASNIMKTSMINKIDADKNKEWDYSEVRHYISAYNKLTGNSLKTEDIFKNYDIDSDGELNSAEQASVLGDDALGLDGFSPEAEEDSESVLLGSLMSTGSYMKYNYCISSLKGEASLNLISQTFNLSSKNNLFSAMFGRKTAASALASYFIGNYKDRYTGSTVDFTV